MFAGTMLCAGWSGVSEKRFFLATHLLQYFHPLHDFFLLSCQVKTRPSMHNIPNISLYHCSVWFNSARIGLIAGFLAWFMNYFPFVFILLRYDNLPL